MSAGQALQCDFITLSKGYYHHDSLSSCHHPLLNRSDMRHEEVTLSDRRAKRWAGTYRSSGNRTAYINIGNCGEPLNICNHNI